jgi:glucose 1-dehydrogenase
MPHFLRGIAVIRQKLQDEIAIVTGSDSGIGQATAIEFAKEGADVVATYFRDKAGAEHTARAVETAGRKAAVFQLDQRDSQAVARLFQDVRNGLGTPTVLVNSAAKNSLGKYVKDMSDGEWDDALRTNLYGPFYCCREFIRGLDGTGKHGCIINITSVHQEIPRAGAAEYDSSKGGLRNLTTTLALELAEQNININNIAPGMVLTPMNQQAIDDPEILRQRVQSIPMKRAARPEEIAYAAVFLASEQARYIQGATLVVDGALMLFQGQGA